MWLFAWVEYFNYVAILFLFFFIHYNYTSIQVKNDMFSFPERKFFVSVILRLIRCEFGFILLHLPLKTNKAKIITSSVVIAIFISKLSGFYLRDLKSFQEEPIFQTTLLIDWQKQTDERELFEQSFELFSFFPVQLRNFLHFKICRFHHHVAPEYNWARIKH